MGRCQRTTSVIRNTFTDDNTPHPQFSALSPRPIRQLTLPAPHPSLPAPHHPASPAPHHPAGPTHSPLTRTSSPSSPSLRRPHSFTPPQPTSTSQPTNSPLTCASSTPLLAALVKIRGNVFAPLMKQTHHRRSGRGCTLHCSITAQCSRGFLQETLGSNRKQQPPQQSTAGHSSPRQSIGKPQTGSSQSGGCRQGGHCTSPHPETNKPRSTTFSRVRGSPQRHS